MLEAEFIPELRDSVGLVKVSYNTVRSRYPEFLITRPQILYFVWLTGQTIRNLRGLVIRKIKAIPVFFRISRPKTGVSLSGQIPDNETLLGMLNNYRIRLWIKERHDGGNFSTYGTSYPSYTYTVGSRFPDNSRSLRINSG